MEHHLTGTFECQCILTTIFKYFYKLENMHTSRCVQTMVSTYESYPNNFVVIYALSTQSHSNK
jgi:hypothetical protein